MLQTNYTPNLLGLQGVEIIKEKKTDTHTIYYLELPVKPHKCPNCGETTTYIHDYRNQVIKHTKGYVDSIQLVLRKRRYCCNYCNKRFYENNPWLNRYYRMTKNLIGDIVNKLRKSVSFKHVAKECNVSPATVVRVFDCINYSARELPVILAIDEFKGNTDGERFQCIITDPVNKKIVEILPDRDKNTVSAFLLKHNRNNTTHFISDMWKPYAQIASSLFKNAIHVIDKYHFVRQISFAFETVRKETQKLFTDYRRKYFKRSKRLLLKSFDKLTDEQKQEVNVMLYAAPALSEAYWLKQSFYNLLKVNDFDQQKSLLSDFILYAQNSNIPSFIKCANTLATWSKGILNALACTYTNAFTEGTNNKIKVLKRIGYGYRNFRRFRNRILHLDNA